MAAMRPRLSSSVRPMKVTSALFILLLLALPLPALASDFSGLLTFLFVFYSPVAALVLLMVATAFCALRLFTRASFLIVYSTLCCLATALVLLLAYADTRGKWVLVPTLVAFALLTLAVAPGAGQYLLHRRNLRRQQMCEPTLAEILARDGERRASSKCA